MNPRILNGLRRVKRSSLILAALFWIFAFIFVDPQEVRLYQVLRSNAQVAFAVVMTMIYALLDAFLTGYDKEES